MKVTITKESGRWMTVNELPYAKQIVQDMKDDAWSAKDYAKMAADAVLSAPRYNNDSVREVLSASAEITRDSGIAFEQFGEGCGLLGVWIKATVETWKGFLKISFLLSDAWMLGTDEARDALISHSWIRYYTEQEQE